MRNTTIKIICCTIIALLFFAVSGQAAGPAYLKACYEGEALSKVRAWEKQWVGKKIDASNIDKIKDLVPLSLYDVIKATDRWGDTWFTIVPYQQVPLAPGIIKFTQQYYGKTKADPENGIQGYVSGIPFPDTRDALEMAYNFKTKTIDAYFSTDAGYIVDGKLKYDMALELQNRISYFSGRTDTPPVPAYPKNPKKIWRAFTMISFDPPEVRNQRIMEIQYTDFMKSYDMWMWLPSIRRVKRRSTTERQDSTSGGDNCGYDNQGWDGPILINKYKYLGSKEYLLSRHNDTAKLQHKAGHGFWNNTQRERVKPHILEVTSKDSNFLYSKMVWYLDPESWQLLYVDRYDRRGKLWKVTDQLCHVGKGYNDAPVASFDANTTIDVQRIHGTLGFSEKEYGKEFDKNIFTLYYLQKHGY